MVPFRFKRAPEDFIVEEIPRPVEQPDPAGTHVWFTLEKRGISTPEATRRLARALGRKPSDIAFAGRKDAVAVTRQRMSVEHVDVDTLLSLELTGMRLRDPIRCRRRLRVGQLDGNRFHLKLTALESGARDAIEAALSELGERGVPNRYGEQRFGRGGLELGRALAKADHAAYLEGLVAEASAPSERSAARELLRRATGGTAADMRRSNELVSALPDDLRGVARVLARRRSDDLGELVRAVPRRTRAFHLAILQAKIFNDVLDARLREGTAHEARVGDVVLAPDGRHRVLVEGDSVEGSRPTGPMWSADVMRATGAPGEIELAALTAEGLDPEDLRSVGGLNPRGARRLLTASLGEVEVGPQTDEGVWVAFDLPVGSYATVVLEEVRSRISSTAA